MPTWWGKPSSKEVKRKENKDCFINTRQRKLKSDSEEKHNDKSRGSRRHRCDTISEKGSISPVPSRSPSPPMHVFCCQIAERPHAQPVPLPGLHLPSANHSNSGINVTPKLESTTGSKPSLDFPLPKPGYVSNRGQPTDAEGDVATASVCSDSSIDSDNQSNSHVLSPMASDCENGNRTAMHSSFSVVPKDQSPITIQKSLRASSKPAPQLCNNQLLNNSSKRTSVHLQNIQIARSDGLWSAPDSSMSSPSRSPMSTFAPEQVLNSEFCTAKPYQDIASGHCSSPGVGNNSGHYLVVGDPSGQIFWPRSRCSPEYSPIPSRGMRSPGLSSRIHGNAVAPLHPRAGVAATESPTKRPDGAKQQTHRLPLPLITTTNACPFSPTYSAMATPSTPRSPVSSENLTSPGSSWKKGQFLGRGTFGQVYLGFNSDSGEMCAMKEVTLFSDDPKSRESAKQLGQEVALLSGLRHPNIVQYYGSETVDDKIYIYLEYVSGGSIYKLLQQYGQFGEIAIRNYTRQILSGLAYLHAKNTVHRDIKGANILVDPNGVVKLADFGMAKHISGSSCSLSFKGSPYWMAPEVINNSNGYNFSVDIWSLGCTVLEMATTKPPWSQYEGVAAMFKIGNSKELPEIPDNLSGDGKDFVRLCLQRNPLHRPSATQLLLHPFVNNATMDPSETTPAVRSPAIGPAKLNLCLDSEAAAIYLLRSLRSSDAHTPKIISCPVSPTSRSPLLPSRSLHVSGRTSPCPISSPHTASGSSTPLTGGGGGGAIPFPQTKQPTSSNEGHHSNRNTAYKEPKHDPFWRIQQPSYDIRDASTLNYGNHNRRKAMQGHPKNIYDGKSYLADCLSRLSTADKGSREGKFRS